MRNKKVLISDFQDVVECCLSVKGIDPNIRDNAGYTPLHECSVAGNLRIGIKLIRFGADVNGKALDGTRPIHDAVDNDRLEMTRLLLSQGADPFIANYAGRTPAKLARSPAMKALIQGYFADININTHPNEIQPWKFRPSYDQERKVLSGCDVLGGPPDDDEHMDAIEFDFFDEEPMQMYLLAIGPNAGPRNYHLVNDVVTSLKTTSEVFMSEHKQLTYAQIPSADWQQYTEQREDGLFGAGVLPSGCVIDSSNTRDEQQTDEPKVILVEVGSELKKLLDITTENLNNCTALRYSCNSKDLIRLKSKFKATRIDGSDKKGETGPLEELLKTPVIQRFNLNCDQVKKPCSVTLFDIKHTLRMNGQADKRECTLKKRSAKTAAYKRGGVKSDKTAENILVNAIKSFKSLCLSDGSEDASPPAKKKSAQRGRKPKSVEDVHKNHLNGFVLKGLVQTLVTKTFKKKKKGALLSETVFVVKASGNFSPALLEILNDQEGKQSQDGGSAPPDTGLPVLEKQSKPGESSSYERKQCPAIASSDREMPKLTPC
ncbi:hypothetical protein CAPTEDRAFT_170616 [Capitella teleta]|uniref:Uncharacterized protein n=1 Tax=Capitella teleta TaxID=283909 RepID=R7U794_CAPTE|nr:hypothetical protein CAPTEDRAFT_170616 [Capitella teleta]|eukprot:ELU01991.1 hypothetical protein CAPTEDRAFT_170616 [Capitella teleta]